MYIWHWKLPPYLLLSVPVDRQLSQPLFIVHFWDETINFEAGLHHCREKSFSSLLLKYHILSDLWGPDSGRSFAKHLRLVLLPFAFLPPCKHIEGGNSLGKEKLGRTYLIRYKCQPKKEKVLSTFTVRSLGHTRLPLGDRQTIGFCKWSGIIFVLMLNEYLWFRAVFWIYM